jgi:hypothetical protein
MVLMRTEPYEMRKYEDVFFRFMFAHQKVWPWYCGEQYTIGWYWPNMPQKMWEWSKRRTRNVWMWRKGNLKYDWCFMETSVCCMTLYHSVE